MATMSPSTSASQPKNLPFLPFWALILLVSLYAYWGIVFIPFHPDESTYLFMSRDFWGYGRNLSSLIWKGDSPPDSAMRYRMIDAPLGRLVIGFGLALRGLPPLAVDWDWSKTWDENRSAGALPTEEQLLAGRFATTSLLPLSLLFTYLYARRLGSETSALLSVVLLGFNALVLLHGRRAMAESPLLFGIAFALWGMLYARRFPWLSGLALAFAFNAKHSAAALLPIGLLAAAWEEDNPKGSQWRLSLRGFGCRATQMLLVFTLVTLLLNPFLWNNPFQAAQAAFRLRNELLAKQFTDAQAIAPGKVMTTLPERAAGLLIHLFLAPPSFAEYGNYAEETAAAEARYVQIPGHTLLRGRIGGGLMLTLTLAGWLLALLRIRKGHPIQQQAILLLSLGTASQFLGLVLFVPLAWQRYVIPLTPMVALWSAYFLGSLLNHSWRKATGQVATGNLGQQP